MNWRQAPVSRVRPSTQDVDALFVPVGEVRKAAARAALKAGVSSDWLDDGVQVYFGEQGDFAPFLELDHLNVMMAEPAYMLAMK
jgi:hypothetical protein